jgi:hypothetical protein
LITDAIRKVPLGSYVTRELTILNASIEIRDAIKAAPLVGHTDVELSWNPKAAAPVSGPKVNIRRINLNAVSILTMKYVLYRRHPNMSSVTLSLCDYGVGIDQAKLDERSEVARMDSFPTTRLLSRGEDQGRFGSFRPPAFRFCGRLRRADFTPVCCGFD